LWEAHGSLEGTMRRLPVPDPGIPDTRSSWRFLRWLILGQRGAVMGGAFFGIVWMLAQAVAPLFVGRALDDGVAAQDTTALLWWVGALAGLGLLQAAAGIARHRLAVTNWLSATYICNQLVARAVARLGAALPRRVSAGEVVSIVTNDTPQIGNALDISARLSGAVVSFVVVALLLLNTSVLLGLVVLIGVPLLMLFISPLLRPMHRRQSDQRVERGLLTSLGVDTIAGLRVLRGMGGERAFHDRYAAQSQRVREAGVETGRVVSVVDAMQVLLPGVFVVLLTWLGARLAVQGHISVGELVAFYGWAAFLVLPLRTFTEAADKITRAIVGINRVLLVLRAKPELTWGSRTDWPQRALLVDETSGVTVRPGELVVVACTDSDDAGGLADRLGRYVDAPVSVRDVAADTAIELGKLTEDTVRRHVLVVDADTTLFGGRLRDEIDPAGRCSDAQVAEALAVADAWEVVDGLPEGLDTVIGERGRSLSGGQRQRVALVRALLADTDVLVLVEPTSAVDAHTEARIAERLRTARAGRATVVLSASPLLLRSADRALLVVDGTVAVDGDRHDVGRHPAFRAALDREPAGAGDGEGVRA
jgi:ABC-type multidrug transport system fused ATPase/permease subunit